MRHLLPWLKRGTESRLPASPREYGWGDFDRLFDRFFHDLVPMGFGEGLPHGDWSPSIDVSETDKEVVVRAELPGVEPEKVDISVEGDRLTVSGEKSSTKESKEENTYYSERFHGTFRRTITLPTAVDTESASAEHKDGVVTVRLQKDPKLAPKKISVKVS